jgi:tellurite methyltransferase
MNDNHWDNFYKDFNLIKPSSFAKFCLKNFLKNSTLVDIGCGNGRDSFFFANNEFNVICIDNCKTAINLIASANHPNINPICSKVGDLNFINIDIAYSRFALHAMTEKEEDKMLEWIKKAINSGGYFCIETRSDKEDMPNYHFGADHYRRPTNFKKIKQKIKNLGFTILFETEQRDLSPFKDENPLIIRLICKKD